MSIEIINRALIKLGEPLISSVEQEPNGRLMSLIYEDMRDFVLADHPWRFSIKRVVLAPDEEKPISGFAASYTLPTDFLTLYRFGEYYKRPNYLDNIIRSDERYSIEGNKILCNLTRRIYLTYVSKVTDPNRFSPWFKEALATKIAAEYAMRLKQSPQLLQLFNNDFAMYLERAEMNDELMNDIETIPDGSWVGIRSGWDNGGSYGG